MPIPSFPSSDAFRFEIRIASRRFAARPFTALATLLSLALGLALMSIGGSVTSRLLLRPLPGVVESGDLMVLERLATDDRIGDGSLSWLDFEDLVARLAGPAPIGEPMAFYAASLGLSTSELSGALGTGTRRVDAVVHSDGYGRTLGIEPVLGRWSLDSPNGGAEATLAHDLWLRLGADPGILGRTLRLNGRQVEVVGVLPPGFVGTDHLHRPQVWVSISTFEALATGIDAQWVVRRDEDPWLTVVARRRAGASTPSVATVEPLDAFLRSAYADLVELRPKPWDDHRLAAVPLHDRVLGGSDRRAALERHLGLLFLALCGALAVAYGNGAALLVVRLVDRRKEMAWRAALGAGRSQLLAARASEGLLLGLAATATAPGLVCLLLPLVERLQLPAGAIVDVEWDAALVACLALLGGFGTLLLALVPATAAAGEKATVPGRQMPGRLLFLAGQVALTFVALGAAFQLAGTVHAYRQVDPGFSSERTLALRLDVGAAGHDKADALHTFGRLDEALGAVDGVEAATLAATLPILRSGPMVHMIVNAEGAVEPPPDRSHTALHALVGARFFTTLGRPVTEGRDFDRRDDAEAPPVLIVNRSMARSLWGDRSALGRRVSLVTAEEPYTVVGVVDDGLYARLGDSPEPTLYMAHAQSGRSMVAASLATAATVLVRVEQGLGRERRVQVMRDVRAAVAQVDPAVPVLSVQWLEDLLEEHFAVERQVRSILLAVAVAFLLFCLLGIYGGLTQALVRDRVELALRAALGARSRHLLQRLAGPVVRCLALGILAGIWLVPVTSQLLRGLVFGVGANPSGSWAASAAVLVAAVLVAGVGPVRQALAQEPAAILHGD